MGPDHQPVNRQGPRERRQPGMRTGLAANLGRGHAAAGAGPRQVAKITIYVAGHRREYLPAIDAARAKPVCGPQRADTVMVETLAGPVYRPSRNGRSHRPVAAAHNPSPFRKINSARTAALLQKSSSGSDWV